MDDIPETNEDYVDEVDLLQINLFDPDSSLATFGSDNSSLATFGSDNSSLATYGSDNSSSYQNLESENTNTSQNSRSTLPSIVSDPSRPILRLILTRTQPLQEEASANSFTISHIFSNSDFIENASLTTEVISENNSIVSDTNSINSVPIGQGSPHSLRTDISENSVSGSSSINLEPIGQDSQDSIEVISSETNSVVSEIDNMSEGSSLTLYEDSSVFSEISGLVGQARDILINEVPSVPSQSPPSPSPNNLEVEDIKKPASSSGVNLSATPSRKRKADDYDDEDGQLCSICLDHWTNSGEHRICALKCGHVYGQKCIARWIKDNKNCPTCKLKATKNDIRLLFANKLIAIDTSELNEYKKLLEEEKQQKHTIQTQLTQSLCVERLLRQNIALYKERIESLSKNRICLTNEYNHDVKTVLKHFETYQVCQEGTCRVMDSHFDKKLLAVSLKSPNHIFRGFGIKKYNLENMSSVVFVPLHTNAIRDIKFNQTNNYLLTVSLDKTVKVMDIHTNNIVATYRSDMGLWSSCWDADEEHVFYVGNQQGKITKFDLRRMSNPVECYSTPGDFSPVVSLAALKSDPGNVIPSGGFLACKLNSFWAFEKGTEEYKKYSLPALGPFISMSFDQESQTFLTSSRPSADETSVKNIFYSFQKLDQGTPTCIPVHTFLSGRVQQKLTRTCMIKYNKNMYAAASNEQTIMLWSVSTGKVSANLRNCGLAIDLMPFFNGTRTSLLALSEKKIDFYNFVDLSD